MKARSRQFKIIPECKMNLKVFTLSEKNGKEYNEYNFEGQ